MCDSCGVTGAVRLRDGLTDYLAVLATADFGSLPATDVSLSGEAVGVARRFVEYHIETALHSLTVLDG